MIPYILHVTVITTICFLFYKLFLQKETFYQLNRWTLMGCLAVSFALPLLPVPRAWSWRDKFKETMTAYESPVSVRQETLDKAVSAAPENEDINKKLTDLPAVSRVRARAMRQGRGSSTGHLTGKEPLGTVEASRDEITDTGEPIEKGVVGTTQSMGSEPDGETRTTATQGGNLAQGPSAAKTHVVTSQPTLRKATQTPGTAPPPVRETMVTDGMTTAAAGTVINGAGDKSSNNTFTAGTPGVKTGTPAEKNGAGTLARFFSGTMLLVVLQWLLYAYLFGVLVFGANFLLQLTVLLFQSYCRPVIRDGRFRIIEVSGNRAPCSFGNTIFINPELYDWETYNQILIHEKIHVSGRHTLDIVLAELALVIQWFNPFAWLYRREVENNLEFLTDANVLLDQSIERSSYQLSLLRVSAPHLPFSITNNYNQSLLKRRIVMMNSKRSALHTVWKYFFLLPLLTGLVCALNKPTTALAAATSKLSLAHSPLFHLPAPPADTTKRPLRSSADSATGGGSGSSSGNGQGTSAGKNGSHGNDTGSGYSAGAGNSSGSGSSSADGSSSDDGEATTISDGAKSYKSISGPTYNYSVEPSIAIGYPKTVTIDVSAKVKTAVFKIKDKAYATNFTVTFPETKVAGLSTVYAHPMPNVKIMDIPRFSFMDDSVLTEGSWYATSYGDRLSFELKAEDEDHSWSYTMHVDKGEINPFPGQGNVEFKLVREAGTIVFKGQFDGQEGFGHFHFTPDPSYYSALTQLGVEDLEDRRQFGFFALNIKKDYVSMLSHNGYPHLSQRDLLSLAAMHIDEAFVQYWKGADLGEGDVTDPRTLIRLKALHIDRAYVDELKAAGYDHLTLRELESLKAQHIDKGYIHSLGRGQDNQPIPVRELVSYKAMHIDSGYLQGLRKVGYDNLAMREIENLYALHVTPEYIQQLQGLGYKDLSSRDLCNLMALHVTPDFIKGFRDAGYTDLSARELGSLKALNVTPEIAKSYHDLGFRDIGARTLGNLKAMNVTPEFIKGFTDLGYSDLSANELASLKAMGVTPDFVAGFNKLGFDHIPVRTLTSLKAAGVTPDYVSKMKQQGFVSKDLGKYIRLKTDFN